MGFQRPAASLVEVVRDAGTFGKRVLGILFPGIRCRSGLVPVRRCHVSPAARTVDGNDPPGVVAARRAIRRPAGYDVSRGMGNAVLPIDAQFRQQPGRERHQAVLAPLPLAHQHHHAGAVDVGHPQPQMVQGE